VLRAVADAQWSSDNPGPGQASTASPLSALHVERIQRGSPGPHIVQYMRFDTAEAFRSWIELDPTRFEDPLLYSRLRRQGDELLHDNA
jgi:hypothetical protein